MSRGEKVQAKFIDEPISKFEQDMHRSEGVSLTAPADKELFGDDASEVRNIDAELRDDQSALSKRLRPGGKGDVEAAMEEMKQTGAADELMQKMAPQGKIKDGEYGRKRRPFEYSPERGDAFKGPGTNARSYYDVMAEHNTINERQDVYNKISRIKDEGKRVTKKQEDIKKKKKLDDAQTTISTGTEKPESEFEKQEKAEARAKETSAATQAPVVTPRRNRWDYSGDNSYARGAGGETPTPNRWVEPTPMRMGETPTPRRMAGRSKWDEPPTPGSVAGGETPVYGTQKDPGLMTPTPEISGHKMQMWRLENELNEKNRELTDEELDRLLPAQGYEVVKAPEGYQPAKSQRKVAAPTPLAEASMYYKLPEQKNTKPYDLPATPSHDPNALPYIKPEDLGYFSALLNEVDEEKLTPEEQRDRKIMVLLLKVKNGTPPMRKSALSRF